MISDQNDGRMADYLEQNNSNFIIKDEKEFPSANEPSVKISSKDLHRSYADIKADIERILKDCSYSFNSDTENEIDYFKKEIRKYSEEIKEEEIIEYNSFMKLMEFIDSRRMLIENAGKIDNKFLY